MALLSTLAFLVPHALRAGQGFLNNRAVNKADEKNERRMATSNFINALSPQIRHQPNLVQPKQSGVSSLLGGLAMGVDGFNAFKQFKQSNELFDLQKRAAEQGLAQGAQQLEQGDLSNRAGKLALGQQLGQQLFSQADQQGNVPGRVESFGRGTVSTQPVNVRQTAPTSVVQGFDQAEGGS